MFHPVRALFWEILWNNRIVAPALALLLGLGAWMISESVRAIDAGMAAKSMVEVAVVAFLASLWIVYSCFTLMESHHGWRMNSMTSRWFVLPVRTWVLVAIPQLLGAVCLTLVIGAWWLLARKQVPLVVFEGVWLGLIAVMSVMQAAAWATSRKPWQFWVCMAALALFVLFFISRPSDLKSYIQKPAAFVCFCGFATIAGWIAAYVMAVATRCGAWPGHISLERWREKEPLEYQMPHECSSSLSPVPVMDRGRSLARSGCAVSKELETPNTLEMSVSSAVRNVGRAKETKSRLPRRIGGVESALFWSETYPVFRFFTLGWLALVSSLILLAWFPHRGDKIAQTGFPFILMLFYNILPFFGVLCLVPLAIAVGCVAPGQFRTVTNPFLATQPVTSGMIARSKLMTLFLSWLVVWLPFLLLGPLYRQVQDNPGDLVASSKTYSTMAWIMAISAHAAMGVLPVYLWGRLEGLPVLFLASLGGWAFTWLFGGWLGGTGAEQPVAWALVLLLAVKVSTGAGLLWHNYKQRHMTWQFALSLMGLWLAMGLGLALPAWRDFGAARAAGVLLLLPLVRPAACPLAVALNRHR